MENLAAGRTLDVVKLKQSGRTKRRVALEIAAAIFYQREGPCRTPNRPRDGRVTKNTGSSVTNVHYHVSIAFDHRGRELDGNIAPIAAADDAKPRRPKGLRGGKMSQGPPHR